MTQDSLIELTETATDVIDTVCDDCGRVADTCRLVHGETDFVDLCIECLCPERP
jgi:hypothetical protein